jgi:hypothetical protein
LSDTEDNDDGSKSRRPSTEGAGFNVMLKKSIHEGIESVVGRQTAVAVEFYLDLSIATKDIVGFTQALEKMFTVGSKLMEERCAQALCHNIGIQFSRHEEYGLKEYVEDAKKRWLLGESRATASS